jgi:hypothetical protein
LTLMGETAPRPPGGASRPCSGSQAAARTRRWAARARPPRTRAGASPSTPSARICPEELHLLE